MDFETWTHGAIVEYLKSIIDGNDRRNEVRFEAQEKAVNTALTANDKRFASVNEFRDTLRDQQLAFIPRPEFETKVDAVKNAADLQIATLRADLGVIRTQQQNLLSERQGIKGGWGYAVGVVGFVLVLLSIVLALWSKAAS